MSPIRSRRFLARSSQQKSIEPLLQEALHQPRALRGARAVPSRCQTPATCRVRRSKPCSHRSCGKATRLGGPQTADMQAGIPRTRILMARAALLLTRRHQLQPSTDLQRSCRVNNTTESWQPPSRKMGTSLATHKRSTFKPSGAGSGTLDEFKARRAAEKLGLPSPPATSNAQQHEIHGDTAQVTQLPVRAKARSASQQRSGLVGSSL